MDQEQKEEKENRRLELNNMKRELRNTKDINDKLDKIYNLIDKKVGAALQSDAKSAWERPKTSGR